MICSEGDARAYPGMTEITDATEHMNTWRVAYDLTAIREWLFDQVKKAIS